MQPILMDRIGYLLTETEGQPPSARRLGAGTAPDGSHGGCSICRVVAYDGSHGGCSICRLSAVYSRSAYELRLALPTDVTPPDELEVQAIVVSRGETRTFTPEPDAIRALLAGGSVEWYFPPDVGEVESMTLSLAYRQDGEFSSGTADVTIV